MLADTAGGDADSGLIPSNPPNTFSPDTIATIAGRRSLWLYLILALISLFNSAWLLNEAGVTFTRSYAPTDYHRRQAAALLDGHFWLSRSIFDTQFDNCYVNGGVQQVWGLGVPMYLIPFELLGRAVGVSPFPDRIVLGILLAAFFFYCGTLLIALPQRGFTTVQAIGVVGLVWFSPPLMNLLVNGPQNVYEDASVYALITSLGVLIAMLRFIALGNMRDFWICCFLGGMSGLVRPTHAIYGLLGPAACCLILLRQRRFRDAAAPLSLVAAGLLFLAISNKIRFGALTEFGHKLTLTTADGEMTSRFVNPISFQSPWAAAKELGGALFFALGDIRKMDSFGHNLFPGQTDCFRWRDFYVTAYDPTLLLLIMAGATVGITSLMRQLRQRREPSQHRPERDFHAMPLSLVAFGTISSAVISGFMLRYPGLCARYLYDLWPGFLALSLVAWIAALRYFPKRAALCLLLWLALQVHRMDCRLDHLDCRSAEEARLSLSKQAAPQIFRTSGFYDARHTPPNGLAQNWGLNDGGGGYTLRLPIDKPDFVDLVVSERTVGKGTSDRADVFRARIANDELRLESATVDVNGSIRVHFAVPMGIRLQQNDQLLFLCFVALGDDIDQHSYRKVYSIRWRR